MDLFDSIYNKNLQKVKPLAARVRPVDLSGFIGQDQVIGSDTALRKAIESDQIVSVIFYGPPGCGKTTLAKIISNLTSAYFEEVSAVSSSVGDLRKVLSQAKDRLKLNNQKTILFIDEIHRFNKAQQDVLLPVVEDGIIVLIGATTENPYFEVNSPLISRSRIYEFKPLNDWQMSKILLRAIEVDGDLAGANIEIEKNALEQLVKKSGGDARFALNALDFCIKTAKKSNGKTKVTLKEVTDCIQKKALNYDKNSDSHYDTISAFIKSMRGSDPDGAIYWLAVMIEGGEDPKFIARRMIIFASEDIGNANPNALVVATAAASALDYVGLPEARLNLAQAAIYLATAKKSNVVIRAIDAAISDVKNETNGQVPNHLKDSHYPGAKQLGRGVGYKYPHNYKDGKVEQEYMPKQLKGRKYWVKDQG